MIRLLAIFSFILSPLAFVLAVANARAEPAAAMPMLRDPGDGEDGPPFLLRREARQKSESIAIPYWMNSETSRGRWIPIAGWVSHCQRNAPNEVSCLVHLHVLRKNVKRECGETDEEYYERKITPIEVMRRYTWRAEWWGRPRFKHIVMAEVGRISFGGLQAKASRRRCVPRRVRR